MIPDITSLQQQSCQPCRGGVVPMDGERARELPASVPGWELQESATKLRRTFSFENFMQAQEFAVHAGKVSEQQGHHPEICYGWGYCSVVFYSHKIGGLHLNDFIMAARVNMLE